MAFRVRHPPHSAWKRITKARTSDAGEDALRRLRSFLDAKEPEIVRLLARLWGDQQQAITYQELRTAILNGYIDEQTAQDWMNDYSHFVNEKLRPQWEDAMRAANARLEAEHPGLFFNVHDPGVQEWLSTRGGELITVIGWEQRQAINAMVGRAYAGEWTVDELARAIRPTIGLNRPQAAANLNYYERTKATLLQNNPSMREATAEKRAREAAVKYAEKQHRYRAFMIARTEMAFAYNRGMDEGIKQAIAKGYMGACVRVWVTAADERMCPVCGELEGVEIGMESEYDFSRVNSRLPSGPTPPAHPNCRCAVDYREIAPPLIREERHITETESPYDDELLEEFPLFDLTEAERSARASDTFTIIPPLKGDAIQAQSIYKELQKSQVGKHAYQFITGNGVPVEVTYTTEIPENLRGRTFGKSIEVFAMNTKSIRKTTETIIHEAKHLELDTDYPSQREEVFCFIAEAQHTKSDLTFADIRSIIRTVKRLYPDLPWR